MLSDLYLTYTLLRLGRPLRDLWIGFEISTGFRGNLSITLFCVSLNGCYLRLCSFGTLRRISRVSDAPAKVVDGSFQQHFAEL